MYWDLKSSSCPGLSVTIMKPSMSWLFSGNMLTENTGCVFIKIMRVLSTFLGAIKLFLVSKAFFQYLEEAFNLFWRDRKLLSIYYNYLSMYKKGGLTVTRLSVKGWPKFPFHFQFSPFEAAPGLNAAWCLEVLIIFRCVHLPLCLF